MAQRIMVVDDDSNLRLALKYRLEREKYHVEVAADGFQALDMVNTEPPDVIILDLAMPNMNGVEFLVRLRSNPQMLNIPVIILTAVGLDPYTGGTDDLAVADLIMKPCNAKDLVSAVKRALQGARHGGYVAA